MPKTSHIAKVFLLGLFTLFILSCKDTGSRFELMKPSTTGVAFNNELSYTEAFNPYTYRNFYNGAGVALGDINNDGLIDIYFTGNLVNNALYLNRGDFKFEEIAETAGVACKNIWSSGATFVDINQDGWLDLYVCLPVGPFATLLIAYPGVACVRSRHKEGRSIKIKKKKEKKD